MDNVSAFLGLIKKAGKLEIGEEPVGAACRAKKASLVLIAADAAPNSLRRATHFAEAGQILILPVSMDKETLGAVIGRPPCAMLAVMDIGLSAALAQKIVAENLDLDATCLEALEQKCKKSMQRRKEKHAHQKNLLRGKKTSRPTKVESGNQQK